MSEDRGSGSEPERADVFGAVFLAKLAGFGESGRTDPARQRMRDAMYGCLAGAFDAAGVPWDEVVHEDRGDGVLVLVPARFPVLSLVEPLLSRLAGRQREYNRTAAVHTWIRLRVALHSGFGGWEPWVAVGPAVRHTARLLEAPVLREVQEETRADLAFITSHPLGALRPGESGIEPDAFHEVTVEMAETRATAWIRMVGRGLAQESDEVAAFLRVRRLTRFFTDHEDAESAGEATVADDAMAGVRRERSSDFEEAEFTGDTYVYARPRPSARHPAGEDLSGPNPASDPGPQQAAAVSGMPPDDADAADTAGNPEPRGRSVARWLSGHLPARVPSGAEVSLVVRVVADDHDDAGVRTVALRPLAMDTDGARVTVVVRAPTGLTPLDTSQQQVIHVPPEGDSDPVRFAFRADDIGLQRVQVTAWAGGTFLAELELEISVQQDAPYVNTEPRRTPLPPTDPNAGEATLQVFFDGRHYTFQLLSDAYFFEPVVTESLAAEPGEAVERTIGMLRRLATETTPYSGANARRRLVEAGVGLWNDMVPAQIKEQFWALGEHISAFSIADDRGVIPWELLYPRAPGRDDGFLVERFPVLRRVYGQQRHDGLMHGRPWFIAPEGGPANAREEIAAIRALFGEEGDDHVIGELAELMDLIDSGGAGALHFACHNTHDAARGSEIDMAGGPLVPDLLNSAASARTLEPRRPLVFLNACRTAGVSPRYLTMTGWAKQFMTAGAGAFVGTLWAVRSESATRFARPFYEALHGGEPLGEAGRIARTAARGDDGDPSWLAYTVYGNPTARVRG